MNLKNLPDSQTTRLIVGFVFFMLIILTILSISIITIAQELEDVGRDIGRLASDSQMQQNLSRLQCQNTTNDGGKNKQESPASLNLNKE